LFYQVCKKQQGASIFSSNNILDFGFGWGRIIHFFLKEVNSTNIYGINWDEQIVNVCNESKLKCNFNVYNIYPSTEFKNNYFVFNKTYYFY
jgi:hypothetical protein